MYESTIHRDLLKSELDYRLSRAKAGVAGRGKRRRIAITEEVGGLARAQVR